MLGSFGVQRFSIRWASWVFGVSVVDGTDNWSYPLDCEDYWIWALVTKSAQNGQKCPQLLNLKKSIRNFFGTPSRQHNKRVKNAWKKDFKARKWQSCQQREKLAYGASLPTNVFSCLKTPRAVSLRSGSHWLMGRLGNWLTTRLKSGGLRMRRESV